MNAAEVIKEAAVAGIQIAIEGDGLSLEATAPPPKAIIELITQHKPEIINLLRTGRGRIAETRVSWLDMVVAAENEAGRHRIWRDELARRAADDQLTAVERDTLQRAIASHARDAATFDEVMRLIKRARRVRWRRPLGRIEGAQRGTSRDRRAIRVWWFSPLAACGKYGKYGKFPASFLGEKANSASRCYKLHHFQSPSG